MTPKQKADELVEKFYHFGFPIQLDRLINLGYEMENAKQCALIAVNEINLLVESYEEALGAAQKSDAIEYWQEVKEELNKL